MFVPLISTPPSERRALWKRKGGGGGGGGGRGGGGGKSGGGGSKSSGSKSGSRGSSCVFKSGGGKDKTPTQKVSVKSSGSTTVHDIPSGQLFGGRSVGGGVRNGIYGTSAYGSGYPGTAGKGTTGRGFPYYFWPVSYGGCRDRPTYVCNEEYGSPAAKNRTGGPQHTAEFRSLKGQSTFYVLSDKDTVNSLVKSIKKYCASSSKGLLDAKSIKKPQAYKGPDFGKPTPEEAIQYYRASSIGLYLDGYSNAATLSANESVVDTPLPAGVDADLLSCLNSTIGAGAPLASAASVASAPGPSVLIAVLILALWAMA